MGWFSSPICQRQLYLLLSLMYIKKDKKTFWNWTKDRHPWDFVLFTDLRKMSGRRLSSPLPSCSTHGEKSSLAKGIDWGKIES